MNEITVILNCYKRVEYLREQIIAIENQSIKPKDIWIWYNAPEGETQTDLTEDFADYKIVTANYNFKFHARFALGLLAQTEYVAFFDDDTIPGAQWFENCVKTMNSMGDCVLGTSGVLLMANDYKKRKKVGWNGKHSFEPIEVDLVGHAWFLRQKNLKYLWYEKPASLANGEDMQLSYLCQKYGKIKTIVPPHSNENLDLWGSQPKKGAEYGSDQNASHLHLTNHKSIRDEIVIDLIGRGWKTVRMKERKSISRLFGESFMKVIRKFK